VPQPAPLPYWDLRGQRRFDPGPLPVYKTRMLRRREGFVAHANRPAGGPPRHAHSDQLGSERLAAWTNQTLVSEEAYAPFGEAYAGAGAGEQMLTGKGQRLAAGASLVSEDTKLGMGVADGVLAATAGEYATGIGEAKFVLDAFTFASAGVACALGVAH
jgi:hypothetical protein